MRSEHGYVGMRALVGLGIVTVLIWMVPMVFLSNDQAGVVTSAGTTGEVPAPTGGAVAPVGVTGTTAPAVAVAPTGASGATGAPGAGTAPTDPIGKAKDTQAQSLVSNAIRVAQLWFAGSGSFTDFTVEQASEYEPSITFTTDAPALEVVAMRVTPDGVVMVTLAESGPLCAAFANDTVTFGRVDAASPALCQGGW